MKNFLIPVFLIQIIISIPAQTFSQFDKPLVIGKEYKITLFSEKIITGVLISESEKELVLKTGNKNITVEKANIFEISTDTSPYIYKYLATLNTGTLIGTPNDGNNSNYLFNGRFSYFYKENRNIGGELSVIFLKKAYYTYDLYQNGYYQNPNFSYQNQTYIDLLANAQIGTFDVNNVLEIYLNLGFGVHSQILNSYTTPYYSNIDSTVKYSNTPSSFTVYPMFQIGGGILIKPVKNFGINIELDLKMYSFAYLIVPTESYGPLKLGVSYFLF